ncbi:hypothetical protein LTR48_009397, partial [Friedmanniomyces endolithicus]
PTRLPQRRPHTPERLPPRLSDRQSRPQPRTPFCGDRSHISRTRGSQGRDPQRGRCGRRSGQSLQDALGGADDGVHRAGQAGGTAGAGDEKDRAEGL